MINLQSRIFKKLYTPTRLFYNFSPLILSFFNILNRFFSKNQPQNIKESNMFLRKHRCFRFLISPILLLLLFSCSEGSSQGSCVEAEDFGSVGTIVKSERDDATGIYVHDFNEDGSFNADGGQMVSWQDTYLVYNGDEVVIKISGKIIPWSMEGIDPSTIKDCKICAEYPKNSGNPAGCICMNSSFDPDGCVADDNFNTNRNQLSYRSLARIDEESELMRPDDQEICKFKAGMHAFIGLFGVSGNQLPKNAYHLFAVEEVCDVARISDRCVDEDGADVTKYIYRSEGPLVKEYDDQGNPIEWHQKGEVIKVLFGDRWYEDNSDSYSLEFLSGVERVGAKGLLATIISVIEDLVLGDNSYVIDSDQGNQIDSREGGLLKEMYNNIVTDSGFANAVRLLLTLYVIVFGGAVLAGTIEISRKEISQRVIKMALIIMFISPTSWNIYNDFVVKFFKNGTDEVVAMMVNLSNEYRDTTSATVECNRDISNSNRNATRFSCIDGTIKKLFSPPVTKKILGLFFYTGYGFLLIICIYALIAFFIFTMLYAAMTYVVNLLKIIFVLSLGPIFMCFALFEQTNSLFTNWIKFLVGRSIEIIVLFTTVYFFWHLIDRSFNELLHYKVCYFQKWFIPRILPFPTLVLQADDVNRSFGEWMGQIFEVGALIALTFFVINGMGSVASSLAAFGGADKGGGSKDDQGQASGSSSFALAGDMMKGVAGLAGNGVKYGLKGAAIGGSYGALGATAAVRATGVNKSFNSIGKAIPFRGPRTRWRDSIIDSAIKNAQRSAASKGLGGKEADRFVRNKTMDILMTQKVGHVSEANNNNFRTIHGQGSKFRLAGVDSEAIAKRLDKKLVEEPLKNQIKKEAAALKKEQGENFAHGKEARQAVDNRVKEWAKNNIYGTDSQEIGKHLHNMRSTLKKESALTTSEAAKLFANKSELQSKFMQDLQNEQFERSQKQKMAWARGDVAGAIKGKLKKFGHSFERGVAHNPKLAQDNFARKIARQEDVGAWSKDGDGKNTWRLRFKKLSPTRYVNVADKAVSKMITIPRNALVNIGNMGVRMINEIISSNISKWEPKKVNLAQQLGLGRDQLQKDSALKFIKRANPQNKNDITRDANKAAYMMRKFVNKESISQDQDKKTLAEKAAELNSSLRQWDDKNDRTIEKIAKFLSEKNKKDLDKILQGKNNSQKIAALEKFKAERTTLLSSKLDQDQLREINRIKDEDLATRPEGISDKDYENLQKNNAEEAANNPQYSIQKAFETHLQDQLDLDQKISELQNLQAELEKKTKLETIIEEDEEVDDIIAPQDEAGVDREGVMASGQNFGLDDKGIDDVDYSQDLTMDGDDLSQKLEQKFNINKGSNDDPKAKVELGANNANDDGEDSNSNSDNDSDDDSKANKAKIGRDNISYDVSKDDKKDGPSTDSKEGKDSNIGQSDKRNHDQDKKREQEEKERDKQQKAARSKQNLLSKISQNDYEIKNLSSKDRLENSDLLRIKNLKSENESLREQFNNLDKGDK